MENPDFWEVSFWHEDIEAFGDEIIAETEYEAKLLAELFKGEGPSQIRPKHFYTALRACSGGIMKNGERYVDWAKLKAAQRAIGAIFCVECEDAAPSSENDYLCIQCRSKLIDGA